MSAMRFSASRCRAVRAGPPAPRGRGPERREWRERAERERPSEGGAGGEAGRGCACDPACVACLLSGVGCYGLRWDAVVREMFARSKVTHLKIKINKKYLYSHARARHVSCFFVCVARRARYSSAFRRATRERGEAGASPRESGHRSLACRECREQRCEPLGAAPARACPCRAAETDTAERESGGRDREGLGAPHAARAPRPRRPPVLR